MRYPRRIEHHDLDVYNEAALSRDSEEAPASEKPYSLEFDDILPELGETDRRDSFDRLGDAELFQNRD